MKKAHEVTFERWAWFTPLEITQGVADIVKKVVGVGAGRLHDHMKGAKRMRITVRVELVEKEDKCTS